MGRILKVLLLLPILAVVQTQAASDPDLRDAVLASILGHKHEPRMETVNISPKAVDLGLKPCEIDVSETRPNLYGGMQILGFDDRDIEEDLKQMARPLLGQVTVSQELYDMHEAIRACSEEARTDMGEKFQKNEAFLASIFPG